MDKKLPPSSWAVEARGLTKSFGDHQALRGIDLKVNRGEHLVIFGPNGAGKTTLIKILSTLIKPSSGSVWVDGIDLYDKPEQIRGKIGLVSHNTFLYDDLTVYENLRFYGKMYDVLDLELRISEVISWVQIESRLHDRVGTLSHGLQQRVSIARAILHNPSTLFLDEPEVGLDPYTLTVMREVLGNANAENRTIVVATHNLERGLELADSVVILNSGKVVYQSPKQEMDNTNIQQIYDKYTRTSN